MVRFATFLLTMALSASAFASIDGSYTGGSGFLHQLTIKPLGDGHLVTACLSYGGIRCGAEIEVFVKQTEPGNYEGDEGTMTLHYPPVVCHTDTRLRVFADEEGRLLIRAYVPMSIPTHIYNNRCPARSNLRPSWYIDKRPFNKKS